MKVSDLAEMLPGIEYLHRGDADRELKGCYAGDLLSRVMGNAEAGDAWITIMSNVNVAAVAALTDVACVILAEDIQPDEGLSEKLGGMETSFLTTPMSTYEIAWRIHQILERSE